MPIEGTAMNRPSALEVNGLHKRYGSTIALDGASFSVVAGSVHALLGENGAGKSTLVKVLSGLTSPDRGEITVFDEPAVINNPRQANRFGIRTAFQEISLVPDLSVAQNFMLMEEPLGFLGIIQSRRRNEMVAEELGRIGLTGIDPRAQVRSLDLPIRQKIEIARAVSRSPKLLLLDEPTASLSNRDVHWLSGLVEGLKAQGTTVILISHRMQEVREFCSALTILRNGKAVGSYEMDDIGDERVIELMIGRSLSAVFPPKRPIAPKNGDVPALEVSGLTVDEAVDDLSLSIAPGQVVGVGALQGMGQRELFLALFGAIERKAGEIRVAGAPVWLRLPADAVKAGISLVPEDRKTEALFLELTGQENASLPSLQRYLNAGLVNRRREADDVAGVLQQVQVSPDALWRPLKQFSGGNQQKIALAKWLLTRNRVLLLYDPTRGVDIGTKAEVYRLISDFAGAGGAVLFYSTDIAELVNLSDQVVILYKGRAVETLIGDAVTDTQILRAALGQRATASGRTDDEPRVH
jgi:ribose transport system ATP-binding protein